MPLAAILCLGLNMTDPILAEGALPVSGAKDGLTHFRPSQFIISVKGEP